MLNQFADIFLALLTTLEWSHFLTILIGGYVLFCSNLNFDPSKCNKRFVYEPLWIDLLIILFGNENLKCLFFRVCHFWRDIAVPICTKLILKTCIVFVRSSTDLFRNIDPALIRYNERVESKTDDKVRFKVPFPTSILTERYQTCNFETIPHWNASFYKRIFQLKYFH